MNAVTDQDVVVFVLAGCNAEELAAYAGTDLQTAKARIAHARMDIARDGTAQVVHRDSPDRAGRSLTPT